MKISMPGSMRILAAGAVLATVPFAAPAQAAAAPPACATLTKNATATVLTVRNNCQTSERLRLIATPTTTNCSLYAPGAVRVFTIAGGAPSARLEGC